MGLYAQILRTSGGPSGTTVYGQVSICIFDDVTNLPANGDNCVVLYNQNLNGISNNYSVTVPGTQYPVYSGELGPNTSNGYFTHFTVISLTPGTGIPPDPAADDLTIVNVITTPESAIGAMDGTGQIIATSSFPPIMYSLDNVTFKISFLFTGLSSGLKTAYTTDANGGAVSLPFTIGLLGNILVSDPTIDLGNGNLSRWNAAFNNIWFKYQRKDYEVTGITANGDGNILVAVNADVSKTKTRTTIISAVPGQPNITSPGDFVYINTAKYVGSFEVLTASVGTLVLATAWTTNDGVGFININSLRPYYKIQTVVTFVDPLTGQFNTITSNNTPFPDGHCNVDLQSFLKSLLRAQDYSNYSLLNYRDMQLSASYTVKYAEVWQGNTPQFAVITRPYYLVFAAKQLHDIGGGNLQQYVPYLLGFQPAKWITDFAMPVYNYLFPFDLSFIYSEYMVGIAPYYKILLYDINMNLLADQSVSPLFLLNEDGTFLLNQDSSKFIIASQTLQAGLVEHVGLNRLLINFNTPDTCYYFTAQLLYDVTPISGPVVTYPLTVAQKCRIDKNTPDRQVYLRWIGLTGSWNYYTFVYNQEYTLEVTNQVSVTNFIVDWQNSDTISEVISKNANEKITVHAENMSIADIKGARGLKISPKIQMYAGPAISGNNWLTIDSGTATYNEFETFIDAYSFVITFTLPALNIQYQ